MDSENTHHVRRYNTRWRVYVDYRYYGTYNDLHEAQTVADETVLLREKESDLLVGRWPLNFPEKHPPYNVRRKQNALERGDWELLYGDTVPLQETFQESELDVLPLPPTVVPTTQTDYQKCEKRWQKYKGTEDVRRVLPGGKEEWMAICESVGYDLHEAMVIVGDRFRNPSYGR